MQPGKFIVRQLVQSAVVKDHPRSAHDGLEQLDCDTSEGGQLPDRGGGIHGQAEALQQFLAARAQRAATDEHRISGSGTYHKQVFRDRHPINEGGVPLDAENTGRKHFSRRWRIGLTKSEKLAAGRWLPSGKIPD